MEVDMSAVCACCLEESAKPVLIEAVENEGAVFMLIRVPQGQGPSVLVQVTVRNLESMTGRCARTRTAESVESSTRTNGIDDYIRDVAE